MDNFDNCCVCLNDYASPIIINSGTTICTICMRRLQGDCPKTRIKITTKISNNFVEKFFRNPPPPHEEEINNELSPIRYVIDYGVVMPVMVNGANLVRYGYWHLEYRE